MPIQTHSIFILQGNSLQTAPQTKTRVFILLQRESVTKDENAASYLLLVWRRGGGVARGAGWAGPGREEK